MRYAAETEHIFFVWLQFFRSFLHIERAPLRDIRTTMG